MYQNQRYVYKGNQTPRTPLNTSPQAKSGTFLSLFQTSDAVWVLEPRDLPRSKDGLFSLEQVSSTVSVRLCVSYTS